MKENLNCVAELINTAIDQFLLYTLKVDFYFLLSLNNLNITSLHLMVILRLSISSISLK